MRSGKRGQSYPDGGVVEHPCARLVVEMLQGRTRSWPCVISRLRLESSIREKIRKHVGGGLQSFQVVSKGGFPLPTPAAEALWAFHVGCKCRWCESEESVDCAVCVSRLCVKCWGAQGYRWPWSVPRRCSSVDSARNVERTCRLCLLTDEWCCVQWAREMQRIHCEQQKQNAKRQSRARMQAKPGCERGGHVLRAPEACVAAHGLGDLSLERFIVDIRRALDVEVHSVSRLCGAWAERSQEAASAQHTLGTRLVKMHARRRDLEERTNAVLARLLQMQGRTSIEGGRTAGLLMRPLATAAS